MHIQADRIGCNIRLYDNLNDNPNELTVTGMTDGRVSFGIEDRDGGNRYMEITVDRDELQAALAVSYLPMLSVEAPDGGAFER